MKNAAYIEVQDTNYGILNETIYLTISDSDALREMVTLLSKLNQKCSNVELNRYTFELFKDQFKEGEIWLSEDGYIAYGGNVNTSMKFSNLVWGTGRKIVVVMEDHTILPYFYEEGAGIILCRNFGYILTDEQVEKINRLIGLT